MSEEKRATLLRPPPRDPSRAPIEDVLEVVELGVLGKDIFTNARPAWVPRGARGIYGGTVIAQCLAAAQRTMPTTNPQDNTGGGNDGQEDEGEWLPHSCHCYFLLAGSGTVPILFHVERVRDGRSFATRTVQARQRGRCIFTTTISFVRTRRKTGTDENTSVLAHAAPFEGALPRPPPPEPDPAWRAAGGEGSPLVAYELPAAMTTTSTDADPGAKKMSHGPHNVRLRRWARCRGTITGGTQAHLCALAYLSDSTFIATAVHVHELSQSQSRSQSQNPQQPHQDRRKRREELPKLGMMVSLDHTIYFHAPHAVRADDWLLVDMDSPWAGDGRGFVTQRVFGRHGALLATCVQEGVVRLAGNTDTKL